MGYQVGLEKNADPAQTQLFYCTTGTLLEKLIHCRPPSLEAFTHIVLDEVHERDIDIDLLLLLLKRLYCDSDANPHNCKIVLMSATISTGVHASARALLRVLISNNLSLLGDLFSLPVHNLEFTVQVDCTRTSWQLHSCKRSSYSAGQLKSMYS